MRQLARITCYSLTLAALLLPGDRAYAQLSDTFDVKATLQLCPEFQFGGVEVDVKYTVGVDPTLIDAEVVDSSINTSNNTGTYTVRLPSFFGIIPFNIQANCRNIHGTSDVSNSLSVTNCDNLALFDTDQDGIPNHFEDTNCDNFFSPGDASNPDNVDTDGDGVRDLVEGLQGFDPTNPGSSPRPYIFSGQVFDPDGDQNANAVVWRSGVGSWFIKDFATPGNVLAFPFGLPADIPFTYSPAGLTSDVGVIRFIGNQLQWLFHGAGFLRSTGARANALTFGLFGDNIIIGPWENQGVSNPAVARLFNNQWTFFIFQSDGNIRTQNWGGNGDIPKVQDYDGDGLFDIAVFRPSTQKTFIIGSANAEVFTYEFGTGTADHTVRGDYTGDGIGDVSFWEPISGLFTVLTSDNGFNTARAEQKDPLHYQELQLGLFNVHLPINWNVQNGQLLFTVVDQPA